jgi:hypothetical protein
MRSLVIDPPLRSAQLVRVEGEELDVPYLLFFQLPAPRPAQRGLHCPGVDIPAGPADPHVRLCDPEDIKRGIGIVGTVMQDCLAHREYLAALAVEECIALLDPLQNPTDSEPLACKSVLQRLPLHCFLCSQLALLAVHDTGHALVEDDVKSRTAGILAGPSLGIAGPSLLKAFIPTHVVGSFASSR